MARVVVTCGTACERAARGRGHVGVGTCGRGHVRAPHVGATRGMSIAAAEATVTGITDPWCLIAPAQLEAGAVPVLAAVGPLQLEVVSSRLQSEYGVEVTFEPLPYQHARWAMGGWEKVDEAQADGKLMNLRKMQDVYGRPVLLFPSEVSAKRRNDSNFVSDP